MFPGATVARASTTRKGYTSCSIIQYFTSIARGKLIETPAGKLIRLWSADVVAVVLN
jgi:hypothetical protein